MNRFIFRNGIVNQTFRCLYNIQSFNISKIKVGPSVQMNTENEENDQNHYKLGEELTLEQMKQTYRELADDIEDGDEESILNIFKKNPQKKNENEQSSDQMDFENEAQRIKQMHRSLGEYLSTISSDQLQSKSKDIQKKLRQNRAFGIEEDINDNYQDYSLFDKNMVKLQKSQESVLNDNNNQKSLEFLHDLEKDIKTRVDFEDSYSFILRDPSGKGRNPHQKGFITSFRGKKLNSEERQDQSFKHAGKEDETLEHYGKIEILILLFTVSKERQLEWNNHSTHLFEEDDQESDDEVYIPRLSLKSRLEMYDLHNQGWSVRDLSIRYAALPARVKAIIYQWKYFFDEIYPKIDLEQLEGLLSIEREYERAHEVCDYGIDMEELSNIDSGELRVMFKHANRYVDVKKLEPKEQERLKKLFEEKISKKYDIVTEKYVGDGNKGYQIKSWHMYKTKSKPKVTSLFERVLMNIDKPYKLPKNVQKRLDLGPRRASSGYGQI